MPATERCRSRAHGGDIMSNRDELRGTSPPGFVPFTQKRSNVKGACLNSGGLPFERKPFCRVAHPLTPSWARARWCDVIRLE